VELVNSILETSIAVMTMPPLKELIELLEVIDAGKDKVKVEIEANYDGAGGWRWKLFQPNVRASDYIARRRDARCII